MFVLSKKDTSPDNRNKAGQSNAFFRSAPRSLLQKSRPLAFSDKVLQLQASPFREETENNPSAGIGMPDTVNLVLNSMGVGLEEPTKAFMESAFKYDFGKVQIHNNSAAHQSSADLHAFAYTHANHIVFGKDQYHPESGKGKQLLAHELTHVVQQNNQSHLLPSIQRAACNFYVYDSTEPRYLGKLWKLSANSLAHLSWGGYSIPSGESIEEMMSRVISFLRSEGLRLYRGNTIFKPRERGEWDVYFQDWRRVYCK